MDGSPTERPGWPTRVTFRCGGRPGRDAAGHTVWRGGGVSTASSAATGMGLVRKSAVKKTAGRRIMAAGRACRTEAKPHAMIIRQPWLPPWSGGSCASAPVGACSAGAWLAGVEACAAVVDLSVPMSQRSATSWDHEQGQKGDKCDRAVHGAMCVGVHRASTLNTSTRHTIPSRRYRRRNPCPPSTASTSPGSCTYTRNWMAPQPLEQVHDRDPAPYEPRPARGSPIQECGA